MSQKNSAQNVIQSYRKRQQIGPFVIGGAAVVLVVVGLLVLVFWLTGPNKPGLALFATKTPTPTATFTATPVTPTPVPTNTPTEAPTATITLTPTASGPFTYTVLDTDLGLWDIAQKFNVSLEVLLAINNFDQNHIIHPGDEILIPAPDQQLDTPTPLPTNFKGDITYTVQSGDTIGDIAARFNSTLDAISKKNPTIEDINKINAGDQLVIPVNIVTPVPTKAPTSTRNPLTPSPTSKATNTPVPPTATKAP